MQVAESSSRGDGSRGGAWPRWVWPVYGLLFAAAVPWYAPRAERVVVWVGLPFWVVLSLAASMAIALYTAWLLHRAWPEGHEHDDAGDER